MLKYALRRFLLIWPTLIVVGVITFTLAFYGPGDPAMALLANMGFQNLDVETYLRLRESLGLNRPFVVQFGEWFLRVLQGDFGHSMRTNLKINALIAQRLPISAQLGVAAVSLSVLVGVPLGILAAMRQNTRTDYAILSTFLALSSVPVFVMAPLLMIVLALKLKLTPVGLGWKGLFTSNSIIPVIVLAIGPTLGIVRLTRMGVVETLTQEYIRTARAIGLTERMVIVRHVLRNALTPVVTSVGMTLGYLIVGALFVESIFGIPGFGGLMFSGLQTRDYPVLLACTMVSAFIIMGSNLIVDIIYGLLDPRVTYE
ncbi:MAG: ABC transporter permease [Anaerolineae bacterium]|nr:ABC transporter permease [Anaerolineae bacterium]